MAPTDLPSADSLDREPGGPIGIVLVAGPPGSGKGTQCEMLAQAYRWGHVSSGELFRDEIARQTPLGHRLASSIDSGRFVPDSLTLEVVLAALDGMPFAHVLLDGFPRTLTQARALLDGGSRHHVQLVIELVVPVSVSFERLAQRSRSDDEIAAIRRRLSLYESETRPALDWLGGLGLVVTVDGDQAPEAVRSAIECRLAAIIAPSSIVSPTGSDSASNASAV